MKPVEELIIKTLKKKSFLRSNFELEKRRISKKYKCGLPTNILILSVYRDLIKKKKIKPDKNFEELLKKQKTRTLSGIASIAIFTKPYKCPGKCLYCPSQPKMPKSYLNDEPAVMRAILCNYSPKKQIETRLEALNICGHKTDKIELIIMGGSWTALPKSYQNRFILNCFKAANRFNKHLNTETQKQTTLIDEQKKNEKAKHRIIGMTLETRPDLIDEKEVIRMRKLGATRIELGVQSIYDDVLKFNNRGHLIDRTIKATQLLKDAGFKINYHMMPNLPKSNKNIDLQMFEELFSNSSFQPDMLKIYPCVLTKNSKLYKVWKAGKYKPYSDKEIVDLLIKIKQEIPKYVRIMRLGRDIPAPDIVAGNKMSNIRQVVHAKMIEQNLLCKCIRCREVRNERWEMGNIKLTRIDYNASNGKEIFLSYEDEKNNKILAYLRLRIPSQYFTHKKHYINVLNSCAIIRELKSLGQMVEIDKKNLKASQHMGLGKSLMKAAEEIIKKEFKLNKIAVISGVGVRDYYRKLGYKFQDSYMIKKIK